MAEEAVESVSTEKFSIKDIFIQISNNAAILRIPNAKGTFTTKVVKIPTLVKAFQEHAVPLETPIMPVGCIKYKEKGNHAIVITYHPETRFTAKWRDNVYENCVRPAIIMSSTLYVNGDGSFSLKGSQVFGVKDPAILINDNTRLQRLPFPNIYDNGNVCWGGNSIAGSFKVLTGIGQYVDRIFNSVFNNDLFSNGHVRQFGLETPGDVFNFLKDKETFPQELFREMGSSYTIRSL